MIAHAAKRIAFVVLGYLVGLIAGAAAFPGFLLFISYFNPTSDVWQLLGLGPIAVVVAPVILFFIAWIVLVLTFIPAAILNLVTEIFALRWLWLHLLIAVALAMGAGLIIMPEWFSAMNQDRWLFTLAVGLSALIAGLVYWAIAGRLAGFRPENDAIQIIPAGPSPRQGNG